MVKYEYKQRTLITKDNIVAAADYTVEIPEAAIAVQTRKKSSPFTGTDLTVSWLEPVEGSDDT